MVGKGLTAEGKSRILESSAEWFSNQSKLRGELEEALGSKEREKTADELEIIELVDSATNELLEKHGLSPLRLSPDHIHLLRHEAYEKLFQGAPKGGGRYIPPYQAILFSDLGPDARLEFAQTLYHEMIHFKFWNSLQVTEPDKKLQTYRAGLAVVSRDGKDLSLEDLNEAVVEDLVEQFYATTLRNHPLFTEELAERGRPPRGYSRELGDYRELLDTLGRESGGEYTINNLRKQFVCAAATGRLLPLARVIECILGKGSFRSFVEASKKQTDRPGLDPHGV